ncbi:MAG: PAS domain S-box protein, partial [Desulfobacterales bacterium]|nr:PAS domain S-box protein [Desulfobacterales bacterium]
GDPSQMIWEDIPICRKGSEPSYITAKNIPLPEKGLMISTVWDVTIRKKAEKALKESEERYKALHNASFGGLFIHDQGIILDCNQGLCEISGYAYDELIGINALENLIAPEFRETVRKNIMSGVDHPYEVVGIRKDGTSYPLNVHGKSVPYKGRIVRAVEYQDITEKVKMMEMVIQNEKMLSVGGLAAGMAHEINNPLSGVTQNAELLVNRLTNTKISANRNAAESVGTTIEAIQEFMEIRGVPRILNNITDCGVRMSTVMDNMLNFARRSDSSFNKHNPVELIENILDLAKTEYNLVKGYDFKSITIQKEFEPNLPLIACEGNQIQQVLLNLLKNGAYAMFEKCSKRKNYKPVFTLGIHKHPKSNMLQIEVEDNGPGMDKETQQKIFDPFFTTKPVDAGTGLGLYVSYFIITENHKGAMEVESELGCGTKFIIQLPYDHH